MHSASFLTLYYDGKLMMSPPRIASSQPLFFAPSTYSVMLLPAYLNVHAQGFFASVCAAAFPPINAAARVAAVFAKVLLFIGKIFFSRALKFINDKTIYLAAGGVLRIDFRACRN